MKKVLGLLAIVGFVACSGENKEAADAAAKVTADSLAAVKTADSIAALPKDTTMALKADTLATKAPVEAPKH